MHRDSFFPMSLIKYENLKKFIILKMSKLLVSLANLGKGGAERVLSILSEPLANSFDEVQYVLWEGGEASYPIDSRVRIVSLQELSKREGRLKLINTFRRYVKKEQPDLILSFLTPYNMLVLLSTIGLKQKVVVCERTDPQRLLAGGRPMLKVRDLIYRKAKGIFTQTEYAKSCYKGVLGKKTTVIYNPVMMDEHQVGGALKTEKDKTLVTVGRLEPVKNQALMIEAFAIFSKTHPDYRLVIYGDGPQHETLEEKSQQLGIKDKVLFAGMCDHVWDKIVTADCFILSSNAEGMSNAMIEALCLGLPVISTKVAGATDMIKDGKNGYLVDINDVNAMAERMTQIVDNPDLRQSMSTEAVKAYEILRADKICAQWVECLKNAAK